ncbi:TIGR01777 family oxidoreductase [Bacillus sp. V59.32b]|uniref:TIGR01777 family oxidoreductase n=1 Tax=Bacillus sp. V59.32b TaxID=1758642 RepID=UPI000E3B8C79|nr:TIGR01777 family oxidoreductase [Bacillus sp. V59.32b]RFU69409.1 TIGR01777 family protein [Bacillus sp. V59.32b]
MKIAIAGGSGFVGTALTGELLKEKHEVYILTRNPDKHIPDDAVRYVRWLRDGSHPEKDLEGIDVFMNLSGESLNSGRWTDDRKRRIVESRMQSSKEMVRILSQLQKKPKTVINASAIGYYGTSEVNTYTEETASDGDDFLSRTVQLWEKEAMKASSYTERIVLTRFGVILGEKEGALSSIVLPYKLFGGGKIGSGRQWMSWIHIKDVTRAIIFCMNHQDIQGQVNFTSPNPVHMDLFGRTVGKVLHRPHWFPVPAFMLSTLLGEMSVLVLEGQKVIPEKLLSHHFEFSYPDLSSALEDLLVNRQ